MTSPAIAIQAPSLAASMTTSRVCAPSATRTPIPRVRCAPRKPPARRFRQPRTSGNRHKAETTMLLNRHGANARPTTSSIVEIPSILASGSSAGRRFSAPAPRQAITGQAHHEVLDLIAPNGTADTGRTAAFPLRGTQRLRPRRRRSATRASSLLRAMRHMSACACLPILSRPQPRGQRLPYDDHRRRLRRVALVEEPAVQQSNVHRTK